MTGRRILIGLAGIVVALGAIMGVELAIRGHAPGPTPDPEPIPLKAPTYLDQGWSDGLREKFYFTSQGSELLPYAFLLALERPDGEGLFLDDQYIAQTGFLPAPKASPLNPDRLPIGFVKDPAEGGPMGPMVGLTCAACHTGEITAGDKRIFIDGGASLGDFQMLMTRLSKALDATLADPAKFQRFAARLKQDPQVLRPALEATAIDLRRLEAASYTPNPYGRGRLDAFGHILNAVAGSALNVPGNFRLADAPVSYPFLWTTPAQRYVQWNGVAGNPIGRNLGEVLGVFGHTSVGTGAPATFSSAGRIEELKALEDWVSTLKPPPFPQDALGKVDMVKAARGAELFKTNCAGCHGAPPYRLTNPADAEGGRQWLAVTMVPQVAVKTDPKMLTNFYTRTAETGVLAPVFGGAQQVPAGGVLLAVVGAIVEKDLATHGITGEARKAYYGGRFAPDGTTILQGWTKPPAYKAGPLAGVWATGPFLHNGSVPTVFDLLSPEAERPKIFYVGATRYDAKKLGFVSAADDLSAVEKKRAFLFDTSKPGNTNVGHPFPDPPLPVEDRFAVIEYLKTLEGPDVRSK